MEKSTPHCKLPVVKALIEAGKVRSTMSALTGGAALGFDFEGIKRVVMGLTTKDFYKSMTTHADHRVWQDAYRPQDRSRRGLFEIDGGGGCAHRVFQGVLK